ncbi:GNAT family N-acetyltransferase [Taklimakanibacter deserti]|uniref:GNAT family N-acetyltransferase n=1 Tax=Taklimakanibacter deserti TaxID=2267839 RepID=UPI000E6529FE
MLSDAKLAVLIPADIDRLGPMWLELHRHHRTVAPHLGPFVSDDESWANRKRQYQKIFAGEYFGLVASMGGNDIGYMLSIKRPIDWTATFDSPADLWELVTIVLLPAWRGNGTGMVMLDAWKERVAASDARARLIGVIPDNVKAVSLYGSLGFIPTWVTLTRYQRRPSARALSNTSAAIEAVSESDVASLKALWLSLHRHNQAVSPGLGPWVDDERSWQIGQQHLMRSAREGLLFVAKDKTSNEAAPLGLAGVEIHDMDEHPSWADTLVTDRQVAEIKFLVIAEQARGKGIGTAIMDEVDRLLASRRVHDQFAGAIAPNHQAIRFYEHRGFRPTWLELGSF